MKQLFSKIKKTKAKQSTPKKGNCGGNKCKCGH